MGKLLTIGPNMGPKNLWKKKEDKCHDSYERIMSGQLLGNHMISTMYMESLSLQHSLPAEGKVITKLLEQPVV